MGASFVNGLPWIHVRHLLKTRVQSGCLALFSKAIIEKPVTQFSISVLQASWYKLCGAKRF